MQKLPVVFICNNNQYAYSTPLNLQMACANVADRGPAYGMPAEIVDGNDAIAVYEATAKAWNGRTILFGLVAIVAAAGAVVLTRRRLRSVTPPR